MRGPVRAPRIILRAANRRSLEYRTQPVSKGNLMKNSNRSAHTIACAALGGLALLAGTGVAVADAVSPRILSYSDMVKLSQPTED